MNTETNPIWNNEYGKFKEWLITKIGISEAFFDGLSNDDDWTFVIKLHAMIEAGLNHLLVYHFENQKLAGIFSRLETSNKHTGKIAFVQGCKLLPEACIRFIIALSQVRNILVHDVRNFGFELSQHELGMDSNQRKVWRNAISGSLPESIEDSDGNAFPTRDADVRYLVFTSTFLIMASILQHQEVAQRERCFINSLYHLGQVAFKQFKGAVPSRTP